MTDLEKVIAVAKTAAEAWVVVWEEVNAAAAAAREAWEAWEAAVAAWEEAAR